ncbi:hypothetical protein [Micromonospora vinacea]|uniref:Uncharacterized protein n=1 Tax=Micromonospora vinacea TaxID=709878 RepID=A0ABS0KBJ4_9ACTN|nr:hypothetical protein [Micromonospora vinacea]MBG6106009.1 hypothetical protein [Micromonospora vinacea]WTA65721.1 hypothetical protein OHB51_24885 [Micromonospora sp. NBC_00855]
MPERKTAVVNRDKIAITASGGCSIAVGAKDSVVDAGIEAISNTGRRARRE